VVVTALNVQYPPAPLTDEQREAYVRERWESVRFTSGPKTALGSNGWTLRIFAGVYFDGVSEADCFNHAYDFTRNREAEIAELDEEIEWMHTVLGKCSDYVPPMKRILTKHLLPARAALVKGMKETV
jgi:hypothetical protein